MPIDRFIPGGPISERRDFNPLPIRADFYAGDILNMGAQLQEAHAAIIGINNVSHSKGVVAGSMEEIADVGIGGKSETVGVFGKSQNGKAVFGESPNGIGVAGSSPNGTGIVGLSEDGTGIYCKSKTKEALHAETESIETAAIAAYQMNPQSNTAALYARTHGKGPAAVFHGDVHVSGDIILNNADCAEDFDIADPEISEAGTVMSFGEDGVLVPSAKAYDTCVVGIISGAGNYKPGIILDKQNTGRTRKPIALLGKVYCKADAAYGPIKPGDLLTTSFTPGHAMRAVDPSKAFGAVLGKALKPLESGKGLIPVLIALQ